MNTYFYLTLTIFFSPMERDAPTCQLGVSGYGLCCCSFDQYLKTTISVF